MSSLVVPWLAYPIVLAALSLGCGLLLQWLAGLRLPGALLLPSGLALLSLVAQLAVTTSATAQFAMPAVIATAVAGFGLALGEARRRIDLWAVAAALGAFAAYAAPIVLSGRATFAGFIKLDDTSTFLALTDRAMYHGRSLAGLDLSTYLRTLQILLIHGYPLATFMPLGVGRQIVGGDVAWLFAPCMAFMCAMLSLSLYELGARLVHARWLRAVVAVVAAQSALLYGYALWGGIKEVGTAWALPLLVALVRPALLAGRPRHLIPLATASALLLGVLNVGAAVWLGPTLAFVLIAIFRARGRRGTAEAAGGYLAALVVLALPTLISVGDFLHSNIVSFDPLANLVKPLSPLQLAGVWLTGDFRFDPSRSAATYVLAAIALVAAVAGVAWALRQGNWELPLFVGGSVTSALVLWGYSTPWIAGKAFATASPAIPFAALTAAAVLFGRRRAVEGAVLAVVVAGGVIWSNVLQYHDAWLAPRSQLAELATIGTRFAGDGPALMTEYEPYGVRHFLRKLDAEGASELRFRQVPLRNGELLGKGATANLDDFQLGGILVYRTLVLRRSPVESRPPSLYHLVWSGRAYEVWQRPASPSATVIDHLPLGNDVQPAAVPSCVSVRRLARLAGPTGRLAAVERSATIGLNLSSAPLPPGWGVGQSGSVIPAGAGTLQLSLHVPRAGRYRLWLGGAFRDHIGVSIDGRQVGSLRGRLNNAGQYAELARSELSAGEHAATLHYSGSDLHPGSAGAQFSMGPLVLSSTTSDLPVETTPSSSAKTLCGKRLDWVEAIRG